MGANSLDGRAATRQRVLLIVAAILGVPVFTGIVLLAGIGIAALIGRRGSTDLWVRWGNVGQTFESVNAIFSGLAFVALVVTFAIQFQELRMQRIELKMQREAMNSSNGELHRSAEADLRTLHVELIKMAIDDPQLAAVWPEFERGIPPERNRQYLYANLIIQHVWLNLQIGNYSDDEARGMLRYMFSNPLVRNYWATSEAIRRWFVADTPEQVFSRMVDDLFHEHDAERK
jgi:hypothetical protein